jgi:hypothetical protein
MPQAANFIDLKINLPTYLPTKSKTKPKPAQKMAGFSLGKNKLPADVMSSCIIRPVLMQKASFNAKGQW